MWVVVGRLLDNLPFPPRALSEWAESLHPSLSSASFLPHPMGGACRQSEWVGKKIQGVTRLRQEMEKATDGSLRLEGGDGGPRQRSTWVGGRHLGFGGCHCQRSAEMGERGVRFARFCAPNAAKEEPGPTCSRFARVRIRSANCQPSVFSTRQHSTETRSLTTSVHGAVPRTQYRTGPCSRERTQCHIGLDLSVAL